MSRMGCPAACPGGPKGQALREILEGLVASLPAGSALPSERLLAARYDLARMTVRTEVDRLAAAGSVYRLHGRGTFVAEPRVAQDVLFSSFTEDMRARGFEPGSVVLAQEIIEATSFLASALEIAPGRPWRTWNACARPTAGPWRWSGPTCPPIAFPAWPRPTSRPDRSSTCSRATASGCTRRASACWV